MGPAHEAVADHADVQRFSSSIMVQLTTHCRAHSFQPCASRTAIIAARMSFQVCGFIIVALGNMQPSQQMCLNALRRLAVLVAHPVAGVMHDVELAVRIVRQAMAAGLVVRAGAFHRRVVLRDVEIDRPGPQRGGQRLQRGVERRPDRSNRTFRAGCDLPARCSRA